MPSLLVLYHAGFTYIPTISHYLNSFKLYSEFNVSYLNVDQVFSSAPDFSRYDSILLNYCSRIPSTNYETEPIERALTAFDGVKVLALQDEYFQANQVRAAASRIGFDIVLTCVPQGSVSLIYPKELFPETRFETVLTGYVSDELLHIPDLRPLSERPIVVGYRGRELPYGYGDLGWHKAEIGRRFRTACEKRGVRCDIATDEGSRIYGHRWFEFIMSCRVMLGSESGSNIFDLDGSLERSLQQRLAANPSLRYDEVRELITEHEGTVDMGQISPRVFEAAAMRTALVMIRGNYSGLLHADEHYIPVEADYSNLEAVLDRIEETAELEAMVDRTFRHLIESGSNSYAAFVSRVDKLINDALQAKPKKRHAIPSGTLDVGRVTQTPLGADSYLLDKNRQAAQDASIARHAYQDALEKLTRSYEQVDRLISLLDEVGQERNRATDDNIRIRERLAFLEGEHARLAKDSGS
jgi:hypothetical protein